MKIYYVVLLICSFPGADDNSLFQKFERQHKSHPNYHTPQMKLKEPQFTILHYASGVTYSIQVTCNTPPFLSSLPSMASLPASLPSLLQPSYPSFSSPISSFPSSLLPFSLLPFLPLSLPHSFPSSLLPFFLPFLPPSLPFPSFPSSLLSFLPPSLSSSIPLFLPLSFPTSLLPSLTSHPLFFSPLSLSGFS